MADVLPGFAFDRESARYRNTSTGRFVARRDVLNLMERSIDTAERRLGDLVTALHEKRISPGIFQEQMRTELRRLHLQNSALGAGGFDRLGPREYGRAGQMLRGDYQRLTNLAQGVVDGNVSLPQALNRVSGYVGTARSNFLHAERDASADGAQRRGVRMEERRRLGASEHCVDCVRYAGLGWQPLGTLPVPGEASVCSRNCRCSLERREVEA